MGARPHPRTRAPLRAAAQGRERNDDRNPQPSWQPQPQTANRKAAHNRHRNRRSPGKDEDTSSSRRGSTELGPWFVREVDARLNERKVEVQIGLSLKKRLACPECGTVCGRYDTRTRSWRHLGTMQYRTVLTADLPRVRCQEHGVRQVNVPWAEPGLIVSNHRYLNISDRVLCTPHRVSNKVDGARWRRSSAQRDLLMHN